MTRIELSRLTDEEKDALILALLERVAALEAQLNQPRKTPTNSGLPPSRGHGLGAAVLTRDGDAGGVDDAGLDAAGAQSA